MAWGSSVSECHRSTRGKTLVEVVLPSQSQNPIARTSTETWSLVAVREHPANADDRPLCLPPPSPIFYICGPCRLPHCCWAVAAAAAAAAAPTTNFGDSDRSARGDDADDDDDTSRNNELDDEKWSRNSSFSEKRRKGIKAEEGKEWSYTGFFFFDKKKKRFVAGQCWRCQKEGKLTASFFFTLSLPSIYGRSIVLCDKGREAQ